jgi:hypothetical protein
LAVVLKGLSDSVLGCGVNICDGRLLLVETLGEEQIGELFHHLKWVRDPTRPEVIPNRIDLRLLLTSDHLRATSPDSRILQRLPILSIEAASTSSRHCGTHVACKPLSTRNATEIGAQPVIRLTPETPKPLP